MVKEYLVVAVTYGDGESEYGHRIWSERLKSESTASKIAKFLKDATGKQASVDVFYDP